MRLDGIKLREFLREIYVDTKLDVFQVHIEILLIFLTNYLSYYLDRDD